MSKICIFAGTTEGRLLAEKLAGKGCEITVCVATEYGGKLLHGLRDCEVKAGKMPIDKIREMLSYGEYDLVADATHPYASHITGSIAQACEETATEYLRVLRGASSTEKDGVFVASPEECAEYLKETEGNIMLTIGSKNLPVFCGDEKLKNRIFARVLPLEDSLKVCREQGLPASRIMAMQGPFSLEMNLAMLKACDASYLVTKDTGAAGGYGEKIEAALRLGITPVIIGRPLLEKGLTVEEAAEAIAEKLGLAELYPVCKSRSPKRVVLVGTGMGGDDTRTFGMEKAIFEADCLIGAARMLERAGAVELPGGEYQLPGKNNVKVIKAVMPKDIAEVINRENCRNFAVLLSGDTGFYSGATSLRKAMASEETAGKLVFEAIPGIGSLSYFSAKTGIPWDSIKAVSLHGRACNFEAAVRENIYTFTLLGGKAGAYEALERLVAAGFGGLKVYLGERLGYEDERIAEGKAEELVKQAFDPLSVLIAVNPHARNFSAAAGIEDELFERAEVPMTKSEVRAVTLSKMKLSRSSVVYDIGSGSGSCTVEFAQAAPEGKVYAVEKNPQAVQLTKANLKRFGISNAQVIEGLAPEALEDLPAPTHAFIGGSSGNMKEIADLLLRKNPKVRIVVNTVTLESQAEALELSGNFSYCDICQLSVSKPRKLGRYNLMSAQNPVFIFTMENR